MERMSDLQTMRAHARTMVASEHSGECDIKRPFGMFRFCNDFADHPAHEWEPWRGHWRRCPGRCSGCMTDRERGLWRQIASELDAYLATDNGQETLL